MKFLDSGRQNPRFDLPCPIQMDFQQLKYITRCSMAEALLIGHSHRPNVQYRLH